MKVNLKLNLDKCFFDKQEMKILEFMVLKDGSKLALKKVEAILQFPRLQIAIDIRFFNGLTSYYRIVSPQITYTNSKEYF